MQQSLPRWLRHILFWVLYLLIMGFIDGRYDLKFTRAYTAEVIELPVRIVMVYAVLFRTPLLGKGKWWQWLAEAAIVLVLATFMSRSLMYWVIYPLCYMEEYSIIFWDEYRIIYKFLDLALTLFLVLSLRFTRQFVNFSIKQQQLIVEKTKAELSALRNQTNPHFLFNTLSNIYTLSLRNAPQTSEMVLRLSTILRYILYECNTETIPLSKEIQIIEDYIALEQVRFGKRLNVSGRLDIQDQNFAIPPLLLLPLFENAFKHGAGESRFDIFIDWQIEQRNNLFKFVIENSKETTVSIDNGIGLKNLQRQLELLFDGQYQLEIQDSEFKFSVLLQLGKA
jgi:two-component system, LytTR family, sensor kinase